MSDDGLEDVILEADYGPHKAGATIRVDPDRAAWLRASRRPPVKAKSPEPVAEVKIPEAEEAPNV